MYRFTNVSRLGFDSTVRKGQKLKSILLFRLRALRVVGIKHWQKNKDGVFRVTIARIDRTSDIYKT